MLKESDEIRRRMASQLADDVDRWVKAGGTIKSCTSADNRNYAGMPVTPMMSQRKRSSGGKPMHINPDSAYANP